LIQKGLPSDRSQELLEILNGKEITANEKENLVKALRREVLKNKISTAKPAG